MTAEEDRPPFVLPDILENASGWGPVGSLDKFRNLPYQQFNKADKIGKVADWIGLDRYADRYRRACFPHVPSFAIQGMSDMARSTRRVWSDRSMITCMTGTTRVSNWSTRRVPSVR